MSSRRRTTAIILAIVAVVCAIVGIVLASRPYIYDGAAVCASPFQSWSGHESGVQALVGIFEATNCARWTDSLGGIAITMWVITVVLAVIAITVAARTSTRRQVATAAVTQPAPADVPDPATPATPSQRYTARLAAPDGSFNDVGAETADGRPQHHLRLPRPDTLGDELWELYDASAWPVVLYRLTAPIVSAPEPYTPKAPTFPAA